jgi:hypothetical protein
MCVRRPQLVQISVSLPYWWLRDGFVVPLFAVASPSSKYRLVAPLQHTKRQCFTAARLREILRAGSYKISRVVVLRYDYNNKKQTQAARGARKLSPSPD